MGIDFIRKKGGTIKKAWKGGAKQLASEDLFTRHPECATRSFLADREPGTDVSARQPVEVRVVGERLAIYAVTKLIASNPNPPADLLAAIKESSGCASAEVTTILDLSGSIEVRITK